MKLYNDMTGELQELVPSDGQTFRMYVCGLTVYNYFHIGNARPLVIFDLLRRYLRWRGMRVRYVQNFTDVDDKMIRRAAEEGTDITRVAEKYIAEFYTDADALGVGRADVDARATENIGQIIGLVQRLIDRGYAYAVHPRSADGTEQPDEDVYFSTLKFKGYGKLSHMPLDDLEAGARVEVGEIKRDPMDFALWKAQKPGEPAWASPWGMGRPGWHIECSAMALRYLGETIDLHGGGADLIFPHHENEIAQSEAATGKPFALCWTHNGMINIDNKKMSKSGTFFKVRDAAAQYGYLPIRYFLLSGHYRSPINYTGEALLSAKASLGRINICLANLDFALGHSVDGGEAAAEELAAKLDAQREAFITAMDDDLNTAGALAAIFEMVRMVNTALAAYEREPAPRALVETASARLGELADLLGLREKSDVTSARDDAAQIEELISLRAQAKAARDFKLADGYRDRLTAMGVALEDTSQGTKWKRKTE